MSGASPERQPYAIVRPQWESLEGRAQRLELLPVVREDVRLMYCNSEGAAATFF